MTWGVTPISLLFIALRSIKCSIVSFGVNNSSISLSFEGDAGANRHEGVGYKFGSEVSTTDGLDIVSLA